jgi:Carboxymuconolactone decarboxylase family
MATPGTTDLGNLTSRLPDPNLFIPEFGGIAGALYKATANGSIPQTTINLVQLRAGQIIGNTYHTVRVTGDLRKAGEPEQRITAVASWRDAPNGSIGARPCAAIGPPATLYLQRGMAHAHGPGCLA